jgi:predicted nucleotidyltransferase
VAFIYGSAARGEEKPGSDIDLLIVGDISFSDLVLDLQAPQNALGREINPTVYSIAEFQARLREKHHFVTSVIDEKKIFIFGDEDELRRLAPKRLARRQ